MTMNTHSPGKLILIAPPACGLFSMGLLAINSLQKSGILHSAPIGEFVKGNFHIIGAMAALTAMSGLILSFVLPKSQRRSKLYVTGFIVSFLASVWGFILINPGP